MLRSIGWRKFLEWREFERLEPFGEEIASYRAAQIVQAMWNIAVAGRRPGWPIGEFLLPFGDLPRAEKEPQTIEYQEMVIDAWCKTQNAIVIKNKSLVENQ